MKKIILTVCLVFLATLLFAVNVVAAPDTKWAYKDVEGKQLFMDVFLPDAYEEGNSFPTFVVFHGGSWRTGKAEWHYPDCKYWASRGMIAVSVDYRLKDRDNVDVPLECVKDAKSSVRFLRKNSEKLKVNPDKIVVAGGSAGGQLAAATALIDTAETNDDQYDLSISCVPNLVLLYNPYFKTSDNLNPANFVKENAPPFISFLGDEDQAIPVVDILDFHNKLIQSGAASEYYVGKGGKHGFCNGRNPNNKFFHWSLGLSDNYFVKHGIISGASKVKVPAGVAILDEGDFDTYGRN